MSFIRDGMYKSPSAPAYFLLFGLIFIFYSVDILGLPWKRFYTICFFTLLSLWAIVVIIERCRHVRPVWNRIDSFFVLFLISILISIASNWWDGSLKYLETMPFLFLLPYCLGRVMIVSDCFFLRKISVLMGILMLIILLSTFNNFFQSFYLSESITQSIYEKSFFASLPHGYMLINLLLAITIISLASFVLSPSIKYKSTPIFFERFYFFAGYVFLFVVLLIMFIIPSRTGLIAGLMGVIFLVVYSVSNYSKKTIIMVIVFACIFLTAYIIPWSNYLHSRYAVLIVKPTFFDVTRDGSFLVTSDRNFSSNKNIIQGHVNHLILGNDACMTINNSVTDRWVHYQQAIAIFISRPFGAGANHYGFYSCQGPGAFPHSTLLQVFAELGIIVGFGYCVLIWLTLSTLIRAVRMSWNVHETFIIMWFFTFALMQVLIAQLIGNYFISSSLYFAVGVAASSQNHNIFVRESC